MAVEASDREQAASITLADVARAHTEAGLEFPSGSNASRLVDMLSVFVPRAQGDPADPMGFTPLFLRALAKRQQPPVDLAAGAYPAQRLRLSGLEVALLGAYVERVVRAGLPGAPQAPIVEPPCQGLAKLLDVLVPTADTLPGEKLPTSVERLEELLRNLEYRRDVDHARKLLARGS